MEKFIEWYSKLGGTLPGNIEDFSNKCFVSIEPISSSFKERAAEIKKRYNYKFRLSSIHDNFLKDEPNINNLYFEKI